MYIPRNFLSLFGLLLAFQLGLPSTHASQPIIPGTGQKVAEAGDDFEDPAWEFTHNLPKSSSNIDKDPRYPTGASINARLTEGAFRGAPDVIKRIDTPAGGIPGSKGALFLASRETGIPGRITNEMQQDDLIIEVGNRLGGYVPPDWYPNFIVRVCLPPFDKWEQRTGSHFGVRADVEGPKIKQPQSRRFFFANQSFELENYWPGIFIQFNRKADGYDKDHAVFVLRGNELGHDFVAGPRIEEPGWYTLGMSFTPDGQSHYFAKRGVGPLTGADHLSSQTPYNSPCRKFNAFFFNTVNNDDGRTWSTGFAVDDVEFFYTRR